MDNKGCRGSFCLRKLNNAFFAGVIARKPHPTLSKGEGFKILF
jgi:hypothetical protein